MLAVLAGGRVAAACQRGPRPPGHHLAYSTVVTILTRLHGKGVLSRHKDGRSFRYVPADDPAGLAARRLAQMLDAEPDREGVLTRFVSGLSGVDENLLRRVLGDGTVSRVEGGARCLTRPRVRRPVSSP